MNFTKDGEPGLGTQHQATAAPGMVPGRCVSNDAQIGNRGAQGLQERQGICFRCQNTCPIGSALPVTCGPQDGAYATSNRRLILRIVARILGNDLEKLHNISAAIHVALCGLQQIGQNAGPHDIKLGADGIRQTHGLLSRPKQRR